MYKLKVSYDCGCSYRDYAESDNLEQLAKQGEQFDEQGLRWVIEDDKGNILEASFIHKQIVGFMAALRAKERLANEHRTA